MDATILTDEQQTDGGQRVFTHTTQGGGSWAHGQRRAPCHGPYGWRELVLKGRLPQSLRSSESATRANECPHREQVSLDALTVCQERNPIPSTEKDGKITFRFPFPRSNHFVYFSFTGHRHGISIGMGVLSGSRATGDQGNLRRALITGGCGGAVRDCRDDPFASGARLPPLPRSVDGRVRPS